MNRSEPSARHRSPRAACRRLVVASGESIVTIARLAKTLDGEDPDDVLWVGVTAPAPWRAVEPSLLRRHLGNEFGLVVVNAFDGFDPDAFAAAVGTLRGGGDCVILTPPLAAWPSAADPYWLRMATFPLGPSDFRANYLTRLCACWSADRRVLRCDPDAPCKINVAVKNPPSPISLTESQQQVVAQIIRVAKGHARRPLLLSADRGRGKSTVLGVAAARLLAAGWPRITVVAPHRRAVSTLFRHACVAGGIAFDAVKDCQIGDGELRFRLPYECLSARNGEPGLLLVDEAASMPVTVLQGLLRLSNRLVFATTENGYEGSGQGFRLRFETLVAREMPQFRRARLDAPVRWASNDPLEALVNRSLLLDAETAVPQPGADCRVVALAASALANDESLLRALFGLLVMAHYQTRPSDLRALLDDPLLRIWVVLSERQVVGVLLGSLEGDLDPTVCADVLAGRRRLHGHLLNQSLAVHAGLSEALRLRALRIQRIAVHPEFQRQGLGSRLLASATSWVEREGIDLIGCAFGIEPKLMAFWQNRGLVFARLGMRVDPASAARTLLMTQGLTAAGRLLSQRARQQFQRDLPWALGAVLSDLDPDLALRLLRGRDCIDVALDDDDQAALSRIASGARQVETAAAAVWRWVIILGAEGLIDRDTAPLLAWRLQHWSIERVCEAFGLAGSRALHRCLREQLARSLPVAKGG